LQFYSDLHFWYGIYRAAISRVAAEGKGRTFVYNFNVLLDLNFSKSMLKNTEMTDLNTDVKIEEATHGEDAAYLFKTMFTVPIMIPSKEFDVVKRMVTFPSYFLAGKFRV
jgi:hypothetical protein